MPTVIYVYLEVPIIDESFIVQGAVQIEKTCSATKGR